MFTSTPTAPYFASTVFTAATIDASSVTSSASTSQPAAFSSARSFTLRAVATTWCPREARCFAVALPMPDEHPVISTTFDTFVSSVVMCGSFVLRVSWLNYTIYV